MNIIGGLDVTPAERGCDFRNATRYRTWKLLPSPALQLPPGCSTEPERNSRGASALYEYTVSILSSRKNIRRDIEPLIDDLHLHLKTGRGAQIQIQIEI